MPYMISCLCALILFFSDLQDQSVQEALVILSNAITYAFQQIFYPVGKVCDCLDNGDGKIKLHVDLG